MLRLVVLFLVCFSAALSTPISSGIASYKHLLQNVPFEALPPAEQNSCSTQKFHTCISDYAKELGYTSGQLPKDANQFIEKIVKMESSLKGFESVCKAGKDLIQCMGGETAFKACMTVENFLNLGFSASSAYTYLSMAGQMHYECGQDVFQKIMKDGPCLAKAMQQKSGAIQQCLSAYMKNLQEHPTESCKYSQVYISCISSNYTSVCGGDVGNLMCNIMKSGYMYVMPTCELSCNSKISHSGMCDNQKFKTCSDAFAKAIGFPSGHMPEDGQKFSDKVGQIWATEGLKGFVNLCKAGGVMKECLGGQAQFDRCLNYFAFIKRGLTQKSAGIYVTIIGQIKYECQAKTLQQLEQYGACVGKEMKEHGATFQKCQTDFTKNFEKHPSQFCKLSDEFTKCYCDPINTGCGKPTAKLMCSIFQAGFNATHPHCPVNCKPYSTTVEANKILMLETNRIIN